MVRQAQPREEPLKGAMAFERAIARSLKRRSEGKEQRPRSLVEKFLDAGGGSFLEPIVEKLREFSRRMDARAAEIRDDQKVALEAIEADLWHRVESAMDEWGEGYDEVPFVKFERGQGYVHEDLLRLWLAVRSELHAEEVSPLYPSKLLAWMEHQRLLAESAVPEDDEAAQ